MSQNQKKTLKMAVASLVFGCFLLIPILGVLFSLAAITLGVIALIKISKDKDNLKGRGLAISGVVLGGIGVILIPIIALLAAIAIPNLLRARINASEASAQAALRTISMAAEDYAILKGEYPGSIYSLIKANPPHLTEDYTESIYKGYEFNCNFSFSGYSCEAFPENCGVTGTKRYTIATGGQFFQEECY